MTASKLNLGDRVCVADQYWEKHLRGAIGTVTRPPEVVKENDKGWCHFWRQERDSSGQETRAYWIEFDELVYEPEKKDHPTEAGAFPAESLEII